MFNTIVAIGVVLMQLGIVFLIVAILTKSPLLPTIALWASTKVRIIFAVSVIGSLIYEHVFLYAPCVLCWYQRIAIFAIAILSFTGNLQKSALLRTQITILAIAGGAVAIFHNVLDIFPLGLDVCGVNGTSCLVRYVYEFGYITIPMMSLTILVLALIFVYIAKKYPQAEAVQA